MASYSENHISNKLDVKVVTMAAFSQKFKRKLREEGRYESCEFCGSKAPP